MEDLNVRFKNAQKRIFTAKYVNDVDKLELYALYKQAIYGDIDKECPSIFFYKEYMKWNSWNSKRGLSLESAMRQYISKVDQILNEQ